MATFIPNLENEQDIEIDWGACELVERVPGKLAGRPAVVGTRIMPDTILQSYELGDSVEEIHESFPTLPSSKSSGSSILVLTSWSTITIEGPARRKS